MNNNETEILDEDYETLLAKIEHPKQREFLEQYPKFIVTKTTCEAIGIDESTPYVWRNKDVVFNQTFQALKKRIDEHRLQLYEAELDKRALFGSKNSDILLMFALKAQHPDKYREKPPMLTQIAGNVTIKMDMPDEKIVTVEIPKQIGEGNATE